MKAAGLRTAQFGSAPTMPAWISTLVLSGLLAGLACPAAVAAGTPPPIVGTAAAVAPPVTVTGAWARASLPRQNASVAYMVLQSAAPDALTGVSSPSGMAMLHQSTHSGGMAGMTDMDSLPLPAGRAVALAPGGAHIMLMDLPHALRAGDTVRLTLHFSHGPDQVVAVPVRPVGASGP